jgi:large subunit ribosomal protein L15e
MSMYKYIRNIYKQPKANLGELWQKRLIEWKKQNSTVRIERPTRLDRARSLGYKAKQGYILVRQRLLRQKRQRPKFSGGRRSKHMRRRKILNMSYQWIAEQRAQKKFVNCTVLNSYLVGNDGKYFWYEVILVDRAHPAIRADKRINWICNKKGRAARGLTSAAKKSKNK